MLASRSENAIRCAKSSFSRRRHAQTAPLGAKRTTDSDSASQGLSSHVASNSAGARRRFLQQHFESFGPATPPSLRLPAKEGTLQRHQVPRDRVSYLVESKVIRIESLSDTFPNSCHTIPPRIIHVPVVDNRRYSGRDNRAGQTGRSSSSFTRRPSSSSLAPLSGHQRITSSFDRV